ncbi:hypothetical protein HYALB_00000709 [Hymenoscyphus albidus]|uniref:Uncharacterized protein n=1 Tax=Hymenoscyphus albidus TaxID=595503 RepID=A0A9N9LTA5_9HELO|nr:hypothetical protein HYALB_00000709 [Hymenoscyphus albidus]
METIDLSAAIPFFLHAIVEFPAAVNFYSNPSEQLSSAAPQAEDIIKQYAVLLFSSSLIALAFATRPVDDTSKYVAGAFALYHLAPTVRAARRIRGGETGTSYGKGLGGPYVHLAVHGGCLIGFLGLRLDYWASFQ